MAKDKSGFILYADQKELFDQLPDDKAGQLIKHIFSYVNDENPTAEDLIIKMAFIPIKQQFKRDLKKWEDTRSKRSKAGKISAEKRKQQKATQSTHVKFVEKNPTQSTVNGTVNVTVTDSVTVNGNVKDSSLKKEPKKLSKVLLSDFPFTTERFLNGWKEWLEYRVEIKKSYKSARSEKMALTKLARENETESNCLLSIEQSIAGGYIGLFKIKENGTNKKTGYDPSNFTAEGIDKIINGKSLSS